MSRKYNSEQREKWIKTINPKFNELDWLNKRVYHPTNIKHYKFFKRTSSIKEYINPKKIVGLEYTYSYNCPSFGDKRIKWIYMLHWLKRLDRVIDNFKNRNSLIKHINNDLDEKVVIKYGTHYFTVSGQHRLFIAKCLELEKVEVNVIKYEFDKKLFVREKRIEKLFPALINNKFIDKEFKLDINNNFLYLTINNRNVLLRKDLIIEFLTRFEIIKRNRFNIILHIKSLFYQEKRTLINNIGEFKYIENNLIKHLKTYDI